VNALLEQVAGRLACNRSARGLAVRSYNSSKEGGGGIQSPASEPVVESKNKRGRPRKRLA
jgi:hypothetical protein